MFESHDRRDKDCTSLKTLFVSAHVELTDSVDALNSFHAAEDFGLAHAEFGLPCMLSRAGRPRYLCNENLYFFKLRRSAHVQRARGLFDVHAVHF